jgi:CHAD domain-containing protein
MEGLIAARHSSARSGSGPQRLLRAAATGARTPVPLNRKMAADAAFRAILADCLGAASAQAGVLRAGRSAAALHRLRVALRRLEVMLAAFGKAFAQDWFADLRGRAKAISARLAPARDLDVFLEDLWPEATKSLEARGDGGDFTALRRDAEALRDQAWAAVETCLASEDFSHLLDDVAALSQSRLPMAGGDTLKRVAPRLLQRAAKRVEKRGRKARSLEEGDLHRLRIALKKLRYIAQAFAPLYDTRKVAPYLAAVKRLQEELGHLNDIAHARTTIADLLRVGLVSEIGYGAGLFAGHYRAGRDAHARKAMKRYGDFKDRKRFWT